MGKKRTFIVKVNIDDMSALISALDGNDEKADWIDGYMVGVHGHPPRETWSEAKKSGHGFGSSQFEAIEEFRAEQAAKSALAVEARKSPESNPRVTQAYTQPTTQPGTLYPIIQQSNNPEIQKTKEPRTRFVPPTIDELTAYSKEIGLRDPQKFLAYYESNGWKVGRNPMKDWRAAARTWKSNEKTFGSQSSRATMIPKTLDSAYYQTPTQGELDGLPY